MSVNEILAELDTLSPDELKIVQDKLYLLQEDIEETSEMLAAIEEGLRSSREEPSCTIEDLREDLRKWNSDLKYRPKPGATLIRSCGTSRLTIQPR